MVKLMVFNRNEEYVGSVRTLLSAKQFMELNGEDNIEFQTLDDYIEKDFRILYHDRDVDRLYEYIVQEKDESKQGNTIVNSIYAENSIVETTGDFIQYRTQNRGNVRDIDKAVLERTRWSMGTVSNIDSYVDFSFTNTNVRKAISDIMDEFLLEIQTEITWNPSTMSINRKLHLTEKRGSDRGNRITNSRDIVDIERKTLPGLVTTALYGFGKEYEVESSNVGNERRKAVLNLNLLTDGKGYVENNNAKEIWGRVGKDGKKMHNFGLVRFNNIDNQELLLSRTKGELDKLSKPAVSYKVRILDYFRLSGESHDYVELGDDVKLLDKDFTPAINLHIRVLNIDRDLLDVENTIITLGELIRTIADRENEQEKEIEEKEDKLGEPGELDDWGDDGDDDDDWGGLPMYEKVGDLVKAHPSLAIGVSSWIDVNERNAVAQVGTSVSQVFDVLTNKPVYTQTELKKRPTLTNMDGRRWLSFNPDPRTPNSWKVGSERPENSIQQHGQYLEYSNKDDEIQDFFVVFHDRTPEPISGTASAQNYARAGVSSPLGYEFDNISTTRTKGAFNATYINDATLVSSAPGSRFSSGGSSMARRRNEKVAFYPRNTMDPIKIHNLAMNKESYDGYIASAIRGRYSGTDDTWHEQNAFYTGEIAEVVLFTRKLDAIEIGALREYFINKYGARVVRGS